MSDFRLEDLPFPRREPLALLGIDRGRVLPDLSGDLAVYGYGTVPDLVLAAADGERIVLRDVLVLALHTPELDEPGADPDAFELQFELVLPSDPSGELVSVFVPLARFLDVCAARVIGEAPVVVLALCNPRGRTPAPPRWLVGTRVLHFATGDVVSWLDTDSDGHEQIRLQAERWHVMSGR